MVISCCLRLRAEIKDDWEIVLQVEALWIDRRATSSIRSTDSTLATAVQKIVTETGKFCHAPSDSSALVMGSVLRMGSSAQTSGLAKVRSSQAALALRIRSDESLTERRRATGWWLAARCVAFRWPLNDVAKS